jgi:hypothetical protein
MIALGENRVDGVVVEVARRRAKRMVLRVRPDGSVGLTLPLWRVSLASGEAFLRKHWGWVLRMREKAASQRRDAPGPASPEDVEALRALVGALHAEWAERLGEAGVAWRLSRMRSRWGVCNYAKRRVGYSTMLAGKGRDEVEYVVVHELTHLAAHDHGPIFQWLMDARLPDWRERRKRLRG